MHLWNLGVFLGHGQIFPAGWCKMSLLGLLRILCLPGVLFLTVIHGITWKVRLANQLILFSFFVQRKHVNDPSLQVDQNLWGLWPG